MIQRARQVARSHDGYSVLNITILVNGDGNPILWREPEISKLEPRVEINIDLLRENLTDEGLEALLQAITTSKVY